MKHACCEPAVSLLRACSTWGPGRSVSKLRSKLVGDLNPSCFTEEEAKAQRKVPVRSHLEPVRSHLVGHH